jgi:signal transduction histidine kinase/CheY-like chemotaxis protein
VRFECRYDFSGLPRELGLARNDCSDLDVTITPLVLDDVSGYIAQIEDVTKRKQLEGQLHLAQKMEAVGQLAGGVAHDFNNILTAIFGSVELLRGALAKGGNDQLVRESVEQIDRAAQRAAVLTRQLLTFSRGQVTQPQFLNLNRVLAELRKMLDRLIREDIQLELFPAADLWTIRADAGQLEQIIVNLVVNARDAMPSGGKLTIETANVALDEEYLTTHAGSRLGAHVLLTVSDTGQGMDSQTRQRIFEPFFTTKPVGEGTGLGLATVHGIVKQSGGHVEVYSEPQHGSTFKVYLPAITDTPAIEQPRVEPECLPRGNATILLCEDDSAVRHLATHVLQEHGYTVLAAARPHQALELARTQAGPPHLLITDVILPEMNGRQLAAALQQLHPGVRVLYISGYTSNVIVHHGMVDPGIEFVQKPFRTATLVQRVHQVLTAPRTAIPR